MTNPLRRLERMVWRIRQQPLPPWRAAALRVVRTASALARDLMQGQLTLRAMSLVYTTLLSIVPLLALSFSVLKAFGVHNQIYPTLLNFLVPLGDVGEEIARHVVLFIERINVGVLGTLGLGLLVYTAVSLVQKIEESLNYIWHIERPRPFGERFSRYLSVLLIGPLLVFSALGITATLLNVETVQALLAVEALGGLVEVAGRVMPYLLVIAAFTFVYMFIPNARVRLAPALIGGTVGGIAWQSAGWAFATFLASTKSYEAIYSGLATLVLFMFWLYVSWVVLLFGASVAFYVQHPEYLYAEGGEPRLSNRMRERLALSVISLVACRFSAGERAPSLPEMGHQLGVPVHALQVVLDALVQGELVIPSGDDPAAYLPARDPALIEVTQVLDTVRAAGEERFLSPAQTPVPPAVADVLDRMGHAVETSMGGMTVRELVSRGGGPGPDADSAAAPE